MVILRFWCHNYRRVILRFWCDDHWRVILRLWSHNHRLVILRLWCYYSWIMDLWLINWSMIGRWVMVVAVIHRGVLRDLF